MSPERVRRACHPVAPARRGDHSTQRTRRWPNEGTRLPACAGVSNSDGASGLRDAWLTLLGRWDWDGVYLTCRDCGHPAAAAKRFRVLISQANRVLYGHRWHKQGQGLGWVRALEYQKRDVIHYHALMAGVQDLRRLTWMDRWHELAGYARIEPIESTAAVSRYVSKYVVKGGEIDLGGPLTPPELPLFSGSSAGVTPRDLFQRHFSR
jgi:hypothetical protein